MPSPALMPGSGHCFLSWGQYGLSGPWRDRIGSTAASAFSKIFSAAELGDSLEAAFLLKPTGIQVAGWTRAPAPQEVISVMAATLWGSLETMMRALGCPGPKSALFEVDDRRMLAQRVSSNWTLLLVAPSSVGNRQLELRAQRIVSRLSRVRAETVTPRASPEPQT